jgi:very-short-patch-repair endonuclease
MPLTNQNLPFMPYLQDHKLYARENRAAPTLTEKIVRKTILSERPLWYKFTRQKPLWPYIADFYCSKLKLVIEIDGDSHIGSEEYDRHRDYELQSILWITTIRYTNDKVMSNGNNIYEDIIKQIRIQEEKLGLSSGK